MEKEKTNKIRKCSHRKAKILYQALRSKVDAEELCLKIQCGRCKRWIGMRIQFYPLPKDFKQF